MRDTVKRWAVILLPIVIIARVVLLMFQIGSEHETREHAEPPAWPPSPGEILSFRPDDPARHAWAKDENWRLFVAVSATKDGAVQPPDTACLLDPDVMSRNQGRLTLRNRTPSGTWEADWNGHRTTRTRDEVPETELDPAVRAQEAAILDGADCGNTARLELSEAAVQALVDFLSGRDAATAVPPPRVGLNIRAVLPDEAQ